MIKVSVVVPVYNAKGYLEVCLGSLANQTLNDIEVIMVNDGSTDDSADICKKYAKNHKNFKYISQKNQGQSAARNAGIKIAKGEYIGFVDSDDYVENDMFEFLYNNAIQHDAAISACGFMLGKRKLQRDGIRKFYDEAEALDYYLLPGYFEVMIWNKIYKKELFNKVQFLPRDITEDVPTVFRLIAEGKGIYFDSTAKYYYCRRAGSVSGSKFSPAEYKTLEDADEIVEYMENNNLRPRLVYLGQALWYMLVFSRSLSVVGGGYNMELQSRIRKAVCRHLSTLLFTRALKIRTKIKLFLIFLPLNVYRKVGPVRKKIKTAIRSVRSVE